MMRIITNKQYDAIIDIVRDAQKEIDSLQAENKRLKKDLSDLQNFCIRFASDNTKFGNAYNLDFPNSKKSYEDKTY